MKKPANNQTNSPKPSIATTPSIIAADVQIEGNVKTAGELQLDGAITGDLVCGGVVMGESGAVNGTISADSVTIRGKVTGQIRAKSVRLEKSAVVEGDVYHESLSVEAGARLTGRFAHTTDNQQGVKAVATDDTSMETPSFVATKKAAAE